MQTDSFDFPNIYLIRLTPVTRNKKGHLMVTFSFSIRIIHSREFGISYGAFQEMPRCSGINEHVFMKSFHGDGGKITEMWKERFSRGIGTYR